MSARSRVQRSRFIGSDFTESSFYCFCLLSRLLLISSSLLFSLLSGFSFRPGPTNIYWLPILLSHPILPGKKESNAVASPPRPRLLFLPCFSRSALPPLAPPRAPTPPLLLPPSRRANAQAGPERGRLHASRAAGIRCFCATGNPRCPAVRGVFLSGRAPVRWRGRPLPRGERSSAAARMAAEGVRDGMLLHRHSSPLPTRRQRAVRHRHPPHPGVPARPAPWWGATAPLGCGAARPLLHSLLAVSQVRQDTCFSLYFPLLIATGSQVHSICTKARSFTCFWLRHN